MMPELVYLMGILEVRGSDELYIQVLPVLESALDEVYSTLGSVRSTPRELARRRIKREEA